MALGLSLLPYASLILAPRLSVYLAASYIALMLAVGAWAYSARRRVDLLKFAPLSIVTLLIKSWIFLEQFTTQIVLCRSDLRWYKPPRRRVHYQRVDEAAR